MAFFLDLWRQPSVRQRQEDTPAFRDRLAPYRTAIRRGRTHRQQRYSLSPSLLLLENGIISCRIKTSNPPTYLENNISRNFDFEFTATSHYTCSCLRSRSFLHLLQGQRPVRVRHGRRPSLR